MFEVSGASILCGRREFWFKQYLPLAECRFPCWVCVSRGAQWVGWFVCVYQGPGGVWRGWGAASVGAIAPLQSQALLAECALSTHARNLPWSSIVWQVSMCLSATEASTVHWCSHTWHAWNSVACPHSCWFATESHRSHCSHPVMTSCFKHFS